MHISGFLVKIFLSHVAKKLFKSNFRDLQLKLAAMEFASKGKLVEL